MKIKNPDHPYAPKHVREWRYLNAVAWARKDNLVPGTGLLIHKPRFEGDAETKPNFRGCFKANRDIFKGQRVLLNGWSGKRRGEVYIKISLWEGDKHPEDSRARYFKRKAKRIAKQQAKLAREKAKAERAAPRELRRTDTI